MTCECGNTAGGTAFAQTPAWQNFKSKIDAEPTVAAKLHIALTPADGLTDEMHTGAVGIILDDAFESDQSNPDATCVLTGAMNGLADKTIAHPLNYLGGNIQDACDTDLSLTDALDQLGHIDPTAAALVGHIAINAAQMRDAQYSQALENGFSQRFWYVTTLPFRFLGDAAAAAADAAGKSTVLIAFLAVFGIYYLRKK